MAKVTYDVKREHYGDKAYVTGDTRELDPNEAKRLIALGVLAEQKPAKAPESKAAKASSNKAMKAAPENK
ncbi:MAG: hypothetical protein CVV19_00775 [Gammaproteobacteria bacterium HGW-Gammaproteobacteria-9]|nr:MAG: hypothetical protein CVV19_00775 [Gammaproteobacteria bacterium HGW-Gammaproteobacteria-9]